LGESAGDPLLRLTRRALRKTYGFPTAAGPWGIRSVFSDEPPVYPAADGGTCAQPDPATNLRLDCASGFGTASFVTGAFGLVAAAEVVSLLVGG
jgi:tRNA A37 threonylcarbamoyladenosine dehydratase